MSHHPYWQGPSYGCPTCGYGAGFAPGGFVPGMQAGQWPHFGPYGPGWAPYPPGYPAAPTPPMHDRDIRGLVETYLKNDPRLASEAEFTVDVSNGVATLTGTVPDKWTKYFAGEDCYCVPAVVDVVNNLKVVERARERRPHGRRLETEETQ